MQRTTPLRRSMAMFGAIIAGGCAQVSPDVATVCSATVRPPVVASTDGRAATTRLSVLSYNIEGLGFPARSTRGPDLARIAEHLSAMHAAGTAPDVVLFQEMFSGAAKRAVAGSGYPAVVSGPTRTARAVDSFDEPLPGRRKARKGELGIHLAGSGLAIASKYAIVINEGRAYGTQACAGFDCLSNKGIAHARIVIPGVPTPVDLYDTHMNSRLASGAPSDRSLEAHDRQAQEASKFIDTTHDDSFPVIFGGDFNMRHSEERWEGFSRYQRLDLVHRVCAASASGCEVLMSWDGDEPWMDTQDLQFFYSGDRVQLRPVRVEAIFDGGPTGPEMSDHDGFLVTYELRWNPAQAPQPAC